MTDTRQYILLVDDDRGITEALSFALDRSGRTLVLCSDVESAEIALARFPVTHLVTDVQFSGTFGFEGLHFLSRVRTQSPDCRIVLITGYATEQLRLEALRHGASEVLSKPFDTEELETALGALPVSEEPYEVIRIPSIDEILRGDTITPVFQPIVRITEHGATPFGFEALTRVRGRWLAGGPVMLFEYAAKRSRLAELNVVAMARSLEAATVLPEDANVFVNIDPLTFDGRLLVPSLKSVARRTRLPLDRVVLEVTERSAFPDDDVAGRVFDELRDLGLRFALDDHGSAYSHLSLISRIKPSFIKMSQTFGTDFENDETKERIVRHTVSLANDFNCETILEGVETATTSRAAAAMGVPLAQGFHYGRPHAAGHWLGAKSLRAA
ncbi:MAG TPA: EAL domain-containing response regulator [Thermoanaerobaculia bacterium]|jgi:EAL domain-containing protein (putative c-di-GMP-specific phosphodiesterase class I)